jgi:hypothetical protein
LALGILVFVGKGDAPLVGQLGQWDSWRVFFQLSLAIHYKQESSEVVSPDDRIVSIIWFFLSTGQVTIRIWGNSLSVCTRWSDLLFLPGSSYIALPLQLCLVSSSPSKIGAIQFCPQPHETQWSTMPLLWEVGLSPHPHFQTLCLSPSLLADSSVPLEGWLVTPPCSPPLFFVPPLFTDSLPPCPNTILQGWFSISHTHPTVSGWLQFTVYAFQFCWAVVQSAQGLCWTMFLGIG